MTRPTLPASIAILTVFVVTACTATAASPVPAPPTDEVAIFRAMRNEICIPGSANVAAINATMEDGPAGATAAGLRQVAELILGAQQQLDELSVPPALAEFVAADNEYRADRVRLVNELADAMERNDMDAADAVDRELTTTNINTEAAEVANRLAECP